MKTCPSCREIVEEEEKCSNCGEPLDTGDTGCTECSSSLREDLVRYRSAMIVGILVEYLGEACIYLYKLNVFPSLVLSQIGTLIFYAGFIMILVFTYKITRLVGISPVLRGLTSILNCFLLINIGISLYLVLLTRRFDRAGHEAMISRERDMPSQNMSGEG
jgi:hypothetical protein